MDALDEGELFTVHLDDDGHPVQRTVADMTPAEVIAAIGLQEVHLIDRLAETKAPQPRPATAALGSLRPPPQQEVAKQRNPELPERRRCGVQGFPVQLNYLESPGAGLYSSQRPNRLAAGGVPSQHFGAGAAY